MNEQMKSEYSPFIISADSHSPKDLSRWLAHHPQVNKIDHYQDQLRELFEITNPSVASNQAKLQEFLADNKEQDQIIGVWVYYPWRNAIVHLLTEHNFFALRTNRNQKLISAKEQLQLRDFPIAIFGMSIGGVIAKTIIQCGFSQRMTICDDDYFSISNLNRVPVDIFAIGQSKAERVAQDLYQLDPFLKLNVIRKRATQTLIEKLMREKNRPQLLIDAIDDFPMKVLLRQMAKKYRLPLLMCTNLGDSVLFDVERYDLESLQPFHGRVKAALLNKIVNQKLSDDERKMLAVTLVGKNNVPLRAKRSVTQLGITLVGRPQLYSSVTVGAGITAFLVRQIALRKKVVSQQTKIHFPSIFDLEDMMEVN